MKHSGFYNLTHTAIRVAGVAALILGLWTTSPSAHTWRIKPDGTGDAPTINDATFEADPGDTILLAPGTFTGLGNFEINNWGTSMVFVSEAGPDSTTIDCQGLGRGFTIAWGGTVVISGITIENGDALYDPLEGNGGGVLGGSVITDCVFRGNHAAAQGGAIYAWGPATISRNVVAGNTAESLGGGIFFQGNVTVTENTVIGNNCGLQGGGIAGWSPGGLTATVSRNIVQENTAMFSAGISCGDDVTVTDNMVTENAASYQGGGIEAAGDATIVNNIVSGNSAAYAGGGVVCTGSTPTILRNTICENSAPHGAGIAFSQSASHVEANIIAFNIQGPGTECTNSVVWLICCDVYGNEGGDAICGEDERGNFSLDPQFCGVLGSRNYGLQSDSPCAPGNHPGGENCGLVGARPIGCGTTPTRRITWGAMKDMFKD